MKLTSKTADALTLPRGKSEAIYFDKGIPGFGLRLRAGGGTSWVFQYLIGAKQRRMSLGLVGAAALARVPCPTCLRP